MKDGWDGGIVGLILGLATIGGALGYLMRQLEKGEKPRLWMVLLQSAASAFSGALVTLICYGTDVSWYWAGVAAGVAGWAGAAATMSRLDKLVNKKTGVGNVE